MQSICWGKCIPTFSKTSLLLNLLFTLLNCPCLCLSNSVSYLFWCICSGRDLMLYKEHLLEWSPNISCRKTEPDHSLISYFLESWSMTTRFINFYHARICWITFDSNQIIPLPSINDVRWIFLGHMFMFCRSTFILDYKHNSMLISWESSILWWFISGFYICNAIEV